jgi:hypothetical protein
MLISKEEINSQLSRYREHYAFTGMPFDIHSRMQYIRNTSILDFDDLDLDVLAVAHAPSEPSPRNYVLFNIMTGYMLNVKMNDIPMLDKIERFSVQVRIKAMQGSDVKMCIAIDDTHLIHALRKALDGLNDYIKKKEASPDDSLINIEDSLELFGGRDITSQQY